MFGAVGDGVADDTAALNLFFAACNTTRKKGSAAGTDKFKISGPLTITLPAFIDMGGCRIICSSTYGATGTGYAMTITGAMGTSQFNLKASVGGIQLQGPRSTSSNLDGLSLGGTGFNVSNVGFPDWSVDGFRDNIYFGDNDYIMKWDEPVNNAYWRYGWNFNCTNNSGENITIFGGATSDGQNAGNAVAVYSSTENPFLDVGFHGHSLDYNDSNFTINAGKFVFHDVHQENGNSYIMGRVVYTSGKPHPTVLITGESDICFGTGGFNRQVLFDITGACTFIARDVPIQNVDSVLSTTIVQTHGSPTKIVNEFELNLGGTAGAPFMCPVTNKLVNYNFASAITYGPTSSLTAGSVIDTTNTYSTGGLAYNSFKFILGASAQSLKWRVRVDGGGSNILISAAFYATGLTSGSGSMTATCYAEDGTTVVQAATAVGNVISANQAFASNGNTFRVPQGTAFVDFIINATAGAGTISVAAPGVWKL